jgi:hypothetical protein
MVSSEKKRLLKIKIYPTLRVTDWTESAYLIKATLYSTLNSKREQKNFSENKNLQICCCRSKSNDCRQNRSQRRSSRRRLC